VSGAAPPATAFDRATALEEAGPLAWTAIVDDSWSAPPGPNGGYLAAIVLRAMEAALDDPARAVRSLTLHYLRSPAAGPLLVEVAIERSGRRMSTLTARATQGGKLRILAIGAFGVDVESALDYAAQPPVVARPEELTPVPPLPQVRISAYFDMRAAVGPRPFSGAAESLTGGWLRFHDPRPLDAAALAMYADAWWPAPFTRLRGVAGAPTVDLTIHFRDPAAAAAIAPDDPVLAVFRSSTSRAGYFEEDGELWSPDGALLAQSRQLALLVP
jgi:acyl-CoA thioesterase